jgi:hypothetical protein
MAAAGVGTTLLWLAARSAAEGGVRSFGVDVLGDNGPMLALLKRFRARRHRWEAGAVEAEIPLPEASRFDLSKAPIPLREITPLGRSPMPEEVHVIPGRGYAVAWDAPEQINPIIEGFLARHSADRHGMAEAPVGTRH